MFKDSMNRWLTLAFFEETAGKNKDYVRMTLEEGKRLFIACDDPTGYAFAVIHLGGWKHWEAMLSSNLNSEIQDWIDELDAKKRSEALRRIEEKAVEGSFQADKLLLDRGWERRGAGRPSKEEKDRHLSREERLKDNVSAFLKPVSK